MEFFDQFSDTLISTGKMVGEKAKDIADVTKLSYQIRALEQEIHEKYQELGKVLYEANEAGEELPDESDVFEVIREKKEEVDELRAQIKDCGIGTSATRAGILQKLVEKKYLALNSKTQIVTPMLSGEIIYDIVKASISSLLNPELTASWEKGLELVAQGRITSDDYMNKMEDYIRVHIDRVMKYGRSDGLQKVFRKNAVYYEKELNARIAHAKKAAAAGQKAAGKKSPAKKSSKKAEE